MKLPGLFWVSPGEQRPSSSAWRQTFPWNSVLDLAQFFSKVTQATQNNITSSLYKLVPEYGLPHFDYVKPPFVGTDLDQVFSHELVSSR